MTSKSLLAMTKTAAEVRRRHHTVRRTRKRYVARRSRGDCELTKRPLGVEAPSSSRTRGRMLSKGAGRAEREPTWRARGKAGFTQAQLRKAAAAAAATRAREAPSRIARCRYRWRTTGHGHVLKGFAMPGKCRRWGAGAHRTRTERGRRAQ